MIVHDMIRGDAVHADVGGDRAHGHFRNVFGKLSRLRASRRCSRCRNTSTAAITAIRLTDVDAAGSSVASAPSQTGKIGSKIDIIGLSVRRHGRRRHRLPPRFTCARHSPTTSRR